MTEDHSNMKLIMKKYALLSIFVIAAMTICSCQKEYNPSYPDGKKNTHLVTLNTFEPETKTGIIAVPGGYKSSWYPDDFIWLHECNPDKDSYDRITCYESSRLEANDIINGKASFTVELTTDDPQAAKYSYIAAYAPYSYAYVSEWEQADEEEYLYWCEQFGYSGEFVPAHTMVELEFMIEQCPGPHSFDPLADIMISKTVETEGQMTGEATFKFARLGTIVKITLTGLDKYKGTSINEVEFAVGKSFSKSPYIIFDTALEKYSHRSMVIPSSKEDIEMPEQITTFRIFPQEVTIKEDGTADLWIRTYAGELDDKFSMTLIIEGDEYEETILKRNVDLMKERKKIEFNEGGMTVFSVGGWGVADVTDVYCETTINETMDGFTATWEGVEFATGYDCYLTGYGELDENGDPVTTYEKTTMTPVDNGDGTWTVKVENGLAPMTYVLHIKPIPAEGHCLTYDDYSEFEMKIGVPDVYWFAHDCFGNSSSCEPIEGTDGEYLIPIYSPGKVRYKNLSRMYDSSWQVLNANGPWYLYSTEPLKKIHSIELWSKNDSHLNFKVYASANPNEHTEELTGTVIEVSEINVGSGKYHYEAVHKLVRYTFPEGKTYQYYTICGENSGIVMTSQYTYVYYFK